VDLQHFDPTRLDEPQRQALAQELGIGPDDVVVTYLGSIGTWYLLPEMLQQFAAIRGVEPRARVLFITPDDPQTVYAEAARQGLPEGSVLVRKGTRAEVPLLVSLGQASLFFIKPAYSKMASSAVKLGELLAMERPVILNAGVGDNDWLYERYHFGIRVRGFTATDFAEAAQEFPSMLQLPPAHLRKAADEYYSLEQGVAAYRAVYQRLVDPA
jgi:hypothetical protein